MTPAPEPEGAVGVPGGSAVAQPGPARYRAVLDSLDQVVFQTDAAGNWTYLNQAWTKVTGHAVADTLGRPFLEFVHPDEREATLELFKNVVFRGLSHCNHETRYLTADGGSVWVELRASVLYDADGQIHANAGTIIDISERRRLETALSEQTRVLEMIAEGAPLEETLGELAGTLAAQVAAEVRLTSLAAPWHSEVLRQPGLPIEAGTAVVGEPDGRHHTDRAAASHYPFIGASRDQRAEVAIETAGVQVATLTLHHEDPTFTLDDTGGQLLERCGRLAAIAIIRDRAEREVRHRAFHDPLTGLPNRALIADRLEQALRDARRQGSWLALVIVDLDHFKDVNDTFGHEVGDRLLREVAARLTTAVRESDTVARLGGDEFVVVLSGLQHPDDAQRRAGELLHALSEPVLLHSGRIEAAASAGVALSHGGDKTLDDLFREADVAMYRAKQHGGGHILLFDSERDEAKLNLIGLSADLQQAIRADELFLCYQPKVDLLNGRTTGLEGLVRWQHPARGVIFPDSFIPMAETTGAITALSLWVLHTALRQCKRWMTTAPRTRIAINLAGPMLHNPELPNVVIRALAEAQVAPEQLELEITESAVIASPDAAQAVMRRIVAAGVTFAIDDFGTGYSSLAYLKHLPVRALKIDRSFVHDMTNDERDSAIVRSIIDLAHNFGMEVVAEGVESEEVRDLLVALGCDTAQGYLFARPMDADAVPEWLADDPPTGPVRRRELRRPRGAPS